MLRTAIRLAELGMAIFPCRAGRKEPATSTGYKAATTDRKQIERWWHTDPNGNIGLATGAVSGIFVVDVDGGEAEHALAQLEAEHGALPPSVETITARGRHIWFRHPGGTVPNSAGRIAPHIDLRGDGGYVLAPPSVHPSGRRYTWSVDGAGQIADAPRWLLNLIAPLSVSTATLPYKPGATNWAHVFMTGVPEGRRNAALTSVAGYLLRRLDPIAALEIVQWFNTNRCQPPLGGDEVYQIMNSICGRELRRRGFGDGSAS
jgi:hypothetical protein